MTLHRSCPLCRDTIKFCDEDVGSNAIFCPSPNCSFVLHLDNPQLPRDLSVHFIGRLFENIGRPIKYFSSHSIKLKMVDDKGYFDIYFRHSPLPNIVLN